MLSAGIKCLHKVRELKHTIAMLFKSKPALATVMNILGKWGIWSEHTPQTLQYMSHEFYEGGR